MEIPPSKSVGATTWGARHGDPAIEIRRGDHVGIPPSKSVGATTWGARHGDPANLIQKKGLSHVRQPLFRVSS